MRAVSIKSGAARIPGDWRGSAFALFAGDGAVADVLAVETAVPADLFRQAVGLLLCLGHAATDGGGAQYAAAGRDDLA